MKSKKTKPEKKVLQFRFTKADLLAVSIPAGKRFVEVQDSEVRHLRCRIFPPKTASAPRRMTMNLDGKIRGLRIIRKLGEYTPGSGGNTIDSFRVKARAQVALIEKDPQQWLEGSKPSDVTLITLEDAFDLALKASDRREASRKGWLDAQRRFITWMRANHPHVKTWTRLQRDHLRDYMKSLKPTEGATLRGVEELSPTHKRLTMQPIIQTANFMLAENGIPSVAGMLKLSSALKKDPARVYLLDVVTFLDHLKKRGLTSLETGAALAGLAGLSLLEVIRLSWSKVDLQRGLIEISGEVKNKYRNRVIPVPARCLEALKRAYQTRPIQRVQEVNGGAVITSPRGYAFDGNSWVNYSKLLLGEFRLWNKNINWQPKDLRNCLMTLAALKGFAGDVCEQYVGHFQKSVTARHYIPRLSAGSIGEAAQLEHAMQHFRTLVTDLIDAEVEAIEQKQSGQVVEAAVNA